MFVSTMSCFSDETRIGDKIGKKLKKEMDSIPYNKGKNQGKQAPSRHCRLPSRTTNNINYFLQQINVKKTSTRSKIEWNIQLVYSTTCTNSKMLVAYFQAYPLCMQTNNKLHKKQSSTCLGPPNIEKKYKRE